MIRGASWFLASALALALSGCASSTWNVPDNPTSTVTNTQKGQKVVKKKKVKAEKIEATTFEILSHHGGLVTMLDNTQYTVKVGKKQKDGTYNIVLSHKVSPRLLPWTLPTAHMLVNGKRVKPTPPDRLRPLRDGRIQLLWTKEKKALNLELQAWDVSRLVMRPYLRSPTDRPTQATRHLKDETFPKNSFAYRVRLSSPEDRILVQSTRAFTGAKTPRDFLTRFSKEIPYCLRWIPGNNRIPLGFIVDYPEDTDGSVNFYKVKRGTVFCDRAEESTLARGSWELTKVQNTPVIVIDVPNSIAPQNVGLLPGNRDALALAYAQEGTGRKARMVPAVVWKKDVIIDEPVWRFNTTAAQALEKAIQKNKKTQK